jgi:hypothetical protein
MAAVTTIIIKNGIDIHPMVNEMVSALPSEVVRPNCESGVLKQLPIKLDLRL